MKLCSCNIVPIVKITFFSEGEKYAEKNGCLFTETSAKDDENVEHAFKSLNRKIAELKLKWQQQQSHVLSEKHVTSKTNCCLLF